MSLRPFRSSAPQDAALPRNNDPPDVNIPSVFADPEHKAAADLLAAFQERSHRLDREKQRLTLENYFRARASTKDGANDTALRATLATLQAEPALVAPPVPPATSRAATTAIARGIELLHGAKIGPALDHAEQLGELDRQQRAISEAINDQGEVVDTIAIRLSRQFGKELTPAWNALMIELYRAAQRLSQVTWQVQRFRHGCLSNGIRPMHDQIMLPAVSRPALMLGAETEQGSVISEWRRMLERMGILR